MEELKHILCLHAKHYPQMQPTDAVKLIYQNEFGGGHMIRDTESCLRYLRQEYAQTPQDPLAPSFEEIGNGIVRVNLSALQADRVETLGIAFIHSAAAWQGCVDTFKKKLEVLRSLCAKGVFTFDLGALDAYLEAYAQAGYPAVSHSDAYRAAYRPAYRIVKSEYWK